MEKRVNQGRQPDADASKFSNGKSPDSSITADKAGQYSAKQEVHEQNQK